MWLSMWTLLASLVPGFPQAQRSRGPFFLTPDLYQREHRLASTANE